MNNNDTNPGLCGARQQILQNGHGGDITVISTDSTVTMFGRAIQANASTTNNGGQGGHIVVLRATAGWPLAPGSTPAFVQAAGDTTGGGSQAAARSRRSRSTAT